MRHFILYGFAVLITLSCSHKPVEVWSKNPHYLSYKHKPLLLITSDQHYGAVIDLDFDFITYLDYLAENGMNLTRLYPGGMFEPVDKFLPGNPLGPHQGRQLLPWMKSDQAGANPLLAEAGEPSFKYDLDSWNTEYFNRIKNFIDYARKKDIIVEIAFFNGMYADCWPLMAMYHQNNIQNTGKYELQECGLFTTMDSLNLDVVYYQKEYIKKIVTELNEFENLIYDISDEPCLQGMPDGSIIINPDSMIIPWINAMKDAFLEAEGPLPNKHILGQTVQSCSPDLSEEKWCMWLPTEYIGPAERALKLNYKSNKPIVNVESNYFGTSLSQFAYSTDAVRLEGWWFMLGGGAGIINLNGEFYHGQESGGNGTRNQIVPQRKMLKEFMNSLDLTGMSRFTDFSVADTSVICNGLAESGEQYAIYLFHGSWDSDWGCSFLPEAGNYNDTVTINKMPAGSYTVEWIDPVTGTIINTVNINFEGGDYQISSPSYMLDIVLRINKKI
jgi:hypothetical protein